MAHFIGPIGGVMVELRFTYIATKIVIYRYYNS